MTPETLSRLAKEGYNRVPYTREVLSDFDTPLSVYLKLADTPYSYLFESVEGGEKWGRYTIIGLGCSEVMKVYGHEIIYEVNGEVSSRQVVDNPMKEVESLMAQFKVADQEDLPRFNGGLVGYFGYDTVRYVEKRLQKSTPKDTLHIPDILLMVSNDFVVFDNFSNHTRFVTFINPSKKNAIDLAEKKFSDWLDQLRNTSLSKVQKDLSTSPMNAPLDITSFLGKEGYEAAVEKIKKYTLAGDVMQVVPSHRMSTAYDGPPINVYRALRTLNPSPYMYFLNLKEFHIVGSSPEILTRLDNDEVTIRPLAGTRKRGSTRKEDLALEKELLNDPKEIAEHLMLIDLGRNDVGKVSMSGSVEVTEQMTIERYSHVMHISSNVVGKLKPNYNAINVLASALPAGTLSGAPKVRAMEIIDEIEPIKRGVYGGAVGYISWNGNMDMAIALRTAVIKDGQLHNQVGGGIVNDSDPSAEWEETVNKSKAIFRALEIARKGL